MKVLIATFALLIGIILGWFIHRGAETRDYRSLREVSETSEERKIALQAWTKIQDEDLFTAVVSLNGLVRLERGMIDETKDFLSNQVASFYIIHGPPDHPEKVMTDDIREMLETIEEKMEEIPALKAVVEKRLREQEERASGQDEIEGKN